MLSESEIKKIEAEIEEVATAHLNARDIETALSHFTDDIFAVSNTAIFSSHDSLEADISEYYKTLEGINHASWEDIYIYVINERSATFTANFSYGFTSKDGEVTELKGVWTALFILDEGEWKIRLRHETFEQI